MVHFSGKWGRKVGISIGGVDPPPIWGDSVPLGGGGSVPLGGGTVQLFSMGKKSPSNNFIFSKILQIREEEWKKLGNRSPFPNWREGTE